MLPCVGSVGAALGRVGNRTAKTTWLVMAALMA